MPTPRTRRSLLPLTGLIGLVLLVWAALTVIGTEPFDNEGYRVALVCTLTLALAALTVALVAALRRADTERAATGHRTAEARQEAEREGHRAEEAHERAAAADARAATEQKQAERRKREADDHRHGAVRAVAALERERHWSQELRRQIMHLHKAHSALAPHDDLHSLVLRVALDLTDAPKGLLLVRSPREEGPLEVVAAEGFEEDARRSEVAQRFAERAMEQDAVIREDSPQPSGAPVDEEITTLIAIPMFVADELSGVVVCADRPGGFDECDDEVLLSLGDNASSVLQNGQLHTRLRDAFVGTVQLLTEALQAKDPFLRERSEDVAEYVSAVARELGIEDAEREQLAFATLLRDVGKLGISERILLKPGLLSPEERSVVELHPRIGSRLIEQVPGMEEIAPVVLHHHEHWDGGGYPAKLRGEDIPLGARVVAVADAFSAITEPRPYRDPLSSEQACAELERCAGSQFDPRVVALFCAEARERPREPQRGPVATALADTELNLRRSGHEGVLGVGAAALSDSLTLLYSHRHFHETAAAEAERAAMQGVGFGVVIVGLAGLRALNAQGGYARGDDALRDCARTLSNLAVRHDAVACRVGGSRLGLLAPGLDLEAAAALAVEVRTALLAIVPVQVGAAAWSPAMTGEAVIALAQQQLEVAPAPAG